MAPLKKQKTSTAAVVDTIPVASTSTRVTRSKSNLIPKTETAATSKIVEVDKSVKSSKAVPKKTTQPAKAKTTKTDGSEQPVITRAAKAKSSLISTKEATNSTSTSKKTAATAKKVAVNKNLNKEEIKEKVNKPDTKVAPKSILKKTKSITKVKPSTTKDVAEEVEEEEEEEEKDDEKGENPTSKVKEEAFTNLSKTQELLQTAYLGIDSSEGEYSSGEERIDDDDDNDDDDDDNDDEEEEDGEEELEKHFSLKLTDKQEEILRVKTKNLPATENRGVVYLGRIPHGFYENEMKAYFSQFGNVTRLRLSRNKRTGKSKHFAFIEFENAQVAEVVAETMNNYLLYNHVLKCKVVPKEKQHPDLFIGAGRKFNVTPWKKIERARHNKQKNQVQVLRQQKRLLASESKKRKRLDKLGINYNFKGYRAEAVPKPKHQRLNL